MKIKRIRTLAGPNIYSHQSSLVLQLELEEADEKNLSENINLANRLENLLNATASNREMRFQQQTKNVLAEAVKQAALGLMTLAGFG